MGTEGLYRVEGLGFRAVGFRVNPAPNNGDHKGLLLYINIYIYITAHI